MENLSGVQQQVTEGDTFLKQILSKHAPNEQHIDCNPILKKAEEIFTLAMAEVKKLSGPRVDTEGNGATEEEEPQEDGDCELSNHSDIINRLSIEIANSGGVEAHQKTMSLLTILSKYAFEAKLSLSIAALALNYGQCLLLTEVYLSDKIPQHMAVLKGMSDISQYSDKIKSWFDNLNDRVISSMLDLAKMVVKLAELIPMCSSIDVGAISMAKDNIPIATYWGIRGVVTCGAQVNSVDLERITSVAEQWEISSLAHKIENVKQHLQSQLDLLQKHIDKEKSKHSFESIKLQPHIDNQKLLKAMIHVKEDEQPKTPVIPEAMRGKTVLMLISGLDIAMDHDFAILRDLYEESRKRETPPEDQYEVVWVPIPDPLDEWTHDMRTMFQSNRSIMPWTVVDPNEIGSPVMKSIKEGFHFQGQPIVVVFDPSRKIINTDATDMLWIWGNFGFPFSKAREEALWRGEILRPELIINGGFDPGLENWVKEGKYTVIYGGDDVKWISKFVTTTIQARQLRNNPIQIVYVGTNKQNVGEANRSINWIKDNWTDHYLSHTDKIRLFWNRMEHVKRSRTRVGSSTYGEDKVLQGITKMLGYGTWASLFKGQELIAMGDGDSMLLAMNKYCENLEKNANKSFGEAFKEYFDGITSTHHVSRLILPGSHATLLLIGVQCPRVWPDHGKIYHV